MKTVLPATLWMAAATFDRGVGLSHDTLQVTHHIGPNIDAERDLVIEALQSVNVVADVVEEEGLGWTTNGRNGGGDPYFTDGLVKIAILQPQPTDPGEIEKPKAAQ